MNWRYYLGMEARAVAAIAILDDEVRRMLYTTVRDAPEPVTREAAADAVGISRNLAAFHLDKLVAAGLLQARTAAPAPSRVGRAPKVYEPSGRDIAVQIPQRDHTLLAQILLDAAADTPIDDTRGTPATEPTGSYSAAALRAAARRGEHDGVLQRANAGRAASRRLGPERASHLVQRLLREYGFEPCRNADSLRLRNCPFHPLAQTAPGLVCSINHAYLTGALHGLGADQALQPVLEPRPGHCCVAFRPRRSAPSG